MTLSKSLFVMCAEMYGRDAVVLVARVVDKETRGCDDESWGLGGTYGVQ